MTRFRQLLKPDPESTPGAEQQRASAGLADAVRQSRLRWKGGRGPLQCQEKCLLLAVAPYSQYDLVLLDLLDEWVDSARSTVPVYVANLQDYDSPAGLDEDFPGVGQAHQSPVAALFESGMAKSVAWGKKARDLVAATLGLPADELTRRVRVKVPD
jgi:hypothetical protein